jgi:hypothetical protein
MKWYLPIALPSKSQTHQKASCTLIARKHIKHINEEGGILLSELIINVKVK